MPAQPHAPCSTWLRDVIHQALPHDSAALHVSGEARYVDDLPEPPGTLYAAFGMSTEAHARILALDLAPVRAAEGVVAVLAAVDIPGANNVGPVVADEPALAKDRVQFRGQPLFAVAATSVELARRAARLARIEYEPLDPVVTIEQALEAREFVVPSVRCERGTVASLPGAANRLRGRLRCGAQEHFYLEGQIALAIPGERGEMLVHSSTQHPTEIQHLVAAALGVPNAAVTVELRRLGGGFGGKETQAAVYAIGAALLARATRRPVKLRADRDDDIVGTGKRHDFLYQYDVGFDRTGRIEALDLTLASRCGLSADLSAAVNDRAVFHCDNAYFLQNVRIVSHRCRTHTVSSTAFRGFGAPQGMFAAEAVVAAIARHLGVDALDVRKRNLYGPAPRDVTHYGMTLQDNVLLELINELEARAEYRRRREAVKVFNASSPLFRRGLALTPVKFGIAYTTQAMNQGGALVHLYTDGSVHLNHGGTEMGQGLMTKVAQIVAAELQVDLERVQVSATSTGKVPNTSPTAASSGTDINGEAARDACRTLKQRLVRHCAETYRVSPEEVVFLPNQVSIGSTKTLSFNQLVREAYLARVQLSATGYWRTPEIQFDRERWRGTPFYYFAYGAAVAEVAIDVLTGETRLLRADLLHDVGRSLNPAIDRGQIEGGFVQGMGWLTTEEVVWDDRGRLLTRSPSTYKIPAAGDCPPVFNVWLWEKGENVRDVAHRSKAVGEPPLMLALSVFQAISDAVGATSSSREPVPLEAPATPENILKAIHELHRSPGR
ncbi:MAG TPA: xanthine dehydrogenase molybdopterin binding subunit [Burkholderiales bacterium]|nr:xanthine dehydrogenase molybdopterin binding subunit [Burkholderiales bacterium]